MSTNKKSVLSNMFWRFAERCGAQGVSFIVSIVLARMLAPDVYGIVSLIIVFTTVLQIFVDSGFPSALLQKKDADQLDFSTVFFFNVGMSLFLYALMFIFAPTIAHFYEKDFMTPYIRVMSLTLVIGGVKSIEQVIVAKRMIFKQFFWATLTGTIISAGVGIIMAYKGFGAWALIAQRLTNQAIDTIFLWWMLKWKPFFIFSIDRLKPLFKYGSKLLGSSLLDTLTGNLSGMVIGKAYSTEELAYYEKGGNLPFQVVQNLNTSIQSILFPVIAKDQDDKGQVKKILNRSLLTSAYCIFPCMMGMGVCAEPLIRILFAEKWIKMVPYLQIWCFIYAFYLLHTANLQVIQAVGRSDIFLKIEIIKQSLSLIALIVSIQFGVLVMLFAMAGVCVVSFCINAHPNAKLADYGVLAQLKDLLPIVLINLAMGICVFLVGYFLPFSDLPKLIIQILTGIVVYVGVSWLSGVEIFRYLIQTVKSIAFK